jgi:hypothetical protein
VLLSVNVGLPRNVPWQDKTVYTGIWKYPVDGPAMARRLNIDGDGQGDTNGHNGEQRAVLVYQIQSCRHWARYIRRDDRGLRAVRREPDRGHLLPAARRSAGEPANRETPYHRHAHPALIASSNDTSIIIVIIAILRGG